MGVHPHIMGTPDVLNKRIRSHGNDRNTSGVFSRQVPYFLRGFIAVHDRHLNVHQNSVIISFRAPAHFFDRDFPIGRLFDRGPRRRQDFPGYFGIQLIVFRKQDTFARQVGGNSGTRLPRRPIAAGSGELLKDVQQAGTEQRFGNKIIDPGLTGLPLYFRPVIGGKQNNG